MAHQATWGDTGQPLEKLDEVPLDDNWIKLLPQGEIVSAIGYGASYWSQSGKVDSRLQEGGLKRFFIKLSHTDLGKIMVRGEYESMRSLYAISPHMTPEPIGFGTFATDDDTHFFLCEFVDLLYELPDIVDFCKDVADLHLRSQAKTLNRKFGFEVTTCNGTVKQYTAWSSSWERFFTESLKAAFDLEREAHGDSAEIDELYPALLEKVCPRLLRPLETEGRTLPPSLVHGDLWDGNVAVHAQSSQPYIFDASAFWGHNEYEFHIWRGARYRIGRAFLKEYFNHYPVSLPEEDWGGRNLLYSLRADLHDSILFKRTDKFRKLVIESMRQLVAKYPEGYQGSCLAKGEQSDVQHMQDGPTGTGEQCVE